MVLIATSEAAEPKWSNNKRQSAHNYTTLFETRVIGPPLLLVSFSPGFEKLSVTNSYLYLLFHQLSNFTCNHGWYATPALPCVFNKFSLITHVKDLIFVDSQPMMEETILVGDDLMTGPPSPLIPPEIASHVLHGVDLCDGYLRNLFKCLQIHDIEPFCQDEIALYHQCAVKRDKELRQRLQDSEHKLGLSMPIDEANERVSNLESQITTLERRLILASGAEGIEGFRQRWSLHGRLSDTKKRLEALKQGLNGRNMDKPITTSSPSPTPTPTPTSTSKKWFFW
ncbi:hypothetical protein ACFE04_029060 [Oxalis oulophora]